MPNIETEAVKSSAGGRRHVVYWRYRLRGADRWLGAVGRRTADGQLATSDATTAAWRATGYDPVLPSPSGNRELGTFTGPGARRRAEAAVREHIAQMAAR